MIPALVGLFGGLNWWMPSPLARVSRLPVATVTPTPDDAAPVDHPQMPAPPIPVT